MTGRQEDNCESGAHCGRGTRVSVSGVRACCVNAVGVPMHAWQHPAASQADERFITAVVRPHMSEAERAQSRSEWC